MEKPSRTVYTPKAPNVGEHDMAAKAKWKRDGCHSDPKEKSAFRTRSQTPNHSSQKQDLQTIIRQRQIALKDDNFTPNLTNSSKITPSCKERQQNRNCCDNDQTPVTHSQKPCTRVLFSIETRKSGSKKNPEYSETITVNPYNRDVATPSLTETPDCYSSVNLETPIRRIQSSDFQELGEETSNLTVGVRIRPLNHKERNSPSITNVVNIDNSEITVTCSSGIAQRFSYDHCFWSCDSLHSEFADQETVFNAMARPLLDKVLKGYNACLFAYGQTGSGKSFSMMGIETDSHEQFGKEAGIIPRFCHALFESINESENMQERKDLGPNGVTVEISYIEIYNEKIHDLLASSSDREKKTPLKVREHPMLGPYVVDLSQHGVVSYEDLKGWLTVGNSQKATAATIINGKSSRSHSIFSIILTQNQKVVEKGEVYEHSRKSKINLVDLAGSERLSQTHATGDRLREAVSINRSLLTLGKVMASLAENTSSRKRQFIPYRESVLTWLLRESLGGNSRTAMLATISPASVHLEETLATLRYACQARTIVNRVRINEEPRDRVIRQLREEVERLRTSRGECGHQMLTSLPVTSPDEKDYLDSDRCEITEKKKDLQMLKEKLFFIGEEFIETQRCWSDRLEQAEEFKSKELTYLRRCGIALKLDIRKQACLINLTPDPILSGTLLYLIPAGRVNIRREDNIDSISNTDIALSGPLIKDNHCAIENNTEKLILIPGNGPCFVNGEEVTGEHSLHHGDRLVVGGNHYFRVNNPADPTSAMCGGEQADYCFAYQEIRTVQENRLKTELEEAKRRAITELEAAKEEAEKKLGSQRNEYERKLEELGKSLKEHMEALAEIQNEKDELSRKSNLDAEEKCRKSNMNHTYDQEMSVDVPVAPYKSNLLEEVMKALNESIEDPESALANNSINLYDIKIMILEAKQRCKEEGINFDFHHKHVIEDHKLIPVIRVYDQDNDVVAVWEPDYFVDWLLNLQVCETEEDREELKRGDGSWERNEEIVVNDQSSHFLSLSMSEIKRELDDTVTGTDCSDSSAVFNQTSLNISDTLLEEAEVDSSNCSIFEAANRNLQQIEQATYNLKRLLKNSTNRDLDDNLSILDNTVAKMKILLQISDNEYSWQDSYKSEVLIKCEDGLLEETDILSSPSENIVAEIGNRIRVKKSVRFALTTSQQNNGS